MQIKNLKYLLLILLIVSGETLALDIQNRIVSSFKEKDGSTTYRYVCTLVNKSKNPMDIISGLTFYLKAANIIEMKGIKLIKPDREDQGQGYVISLTSNTGIKPGTSFSFGYATKNDPKATLNLRTAIA